MSLGHGAKIVTNGLVFAYDMGPNPGVNKSWKGAPTTNVIETNLSNYTSDNGCTVQLLPTTLEGNPVYRVTFPAGTLPRIRTNFNYTTGQQFTGSIYHRVVTQGSHTPQLIFRENGFGTTYVTISLNSQVWTRSVITHTFSSSGTSMFLLYQSNSNSTSPTVIDFSMPQSELSSFARPFVNGTRSNTQSLLDWTGNNTVTSNSLTYAADGSFGFNGTTDFITLPQPSITFSPNKWTICMWLNPNNQYSRFLTPNSAGIDQWLEYDNTNSRVNVKIAQSADTNERTRAGTSNTVPINQWSNFCVSIDGLNIKIYVNGTLTNEYTESVSIANWSGIWRLGQRGNNTNWFSGAISNFSIYDRALSANEVQQNFQALRGRFGI